MKAAVIGGGLFVLLIIVVLLTVATTQSDTEAFVATTSGSQDIANNGASPSFPAALKSTVASQAASSTVEGENAKNLIPFVLNIWVKDRFELFIAEHAEQAPLAVQIAYVTHSESLHTKDTHDYAVDLFSRFVNYKVALASEDVEINTVQASLKSVQEKLDARYDLRRQFFSHREYEYLFGSDAASDNDALARLAIAQDSTLTREAKKNTIVESLAISSDSEAFKPTVDMHRIQQIKQQYRDNNSRFSAISAEFGDEVAERFNTLWEKQGAWEQKVEDYRAHVKKLQSANLSKQEYSKLIREYETSDFTENEIKRLRVVVNSNN
ncbi:lipase chaperone [Alteromonas genovensis]|uniref:lipase chaperone n=1 Tax=Alteromonas genovensis TaxID=471225 RepID=UPI002FE404FA